MMKPKRRCLALMVLAITLGMTCAPALGQRKSLQSHPGYVDGAELAEAIPDDIEGLEITEVNIAGPLLEALSPMINGQQGELGRVVNKLSGITAVIASGLDHETAGKTRALLTRMAERLENEGWERLVRVRERGARNLVLIHYAGESIDGLTVLAYSDDEATFVNIAGLIDLATLSAIGERMDLPGLDEAAESMNR